MQSMAPSAFAFRFHRQSASREGEAGGPLPAGGDGEAGWGRVADSLARRLRWPAGSFRVVPKQGIGVALGPPETPRFVVERLCRGSAKEGASPGLVGIGTVPAAPTRSSSAS
jgi:hypothetical protein